MKKQFIKLASSIFPGVFTKIAYRQLMNPQSLKLREHELATLNKMEQGNIDFKNFNIKTYCWKGGEQAVLLIHGWEGQAGNFSDLVEKLMKENYTIYAFDAPAHGFSSKGETSIFDFVELVEIMIRKYQVRQLISHSFGGVATTYALCSNPDIHIDKYALFTTPDRFSERIDTIAEQVGIADKVKLRLIHKLTEETGLDLNTVNVSDFVKKTSIKEAYIIHDKDDKIVPLAQSMQVHQSWGASTLEVVEGTGHFRILRTDSVLEKVIAFMK